MLEIVQNEVKSQPTTINAISITVVFYYCMDSHPYLQYSMYALSDSARADQLLNPDPTSTDTSPVSARSSDTADQYRHCTDSNSQFHPLREPSER